MPAVSDSEAREIEQAVQTALAKAGLNGTVKLAEHTLSLKTMGAPVDVDARYLLEQWPLLPPDLRERKASDVAARLMEAERAARGGGSAPRAAAGVANAQAEGAVAPTPRFVPSVRPTGRPAVGPKKPVILPIGSALLVLGLGASAFWFWSRTRPDPTPQSSGTATTLPIVGPETDDERRARVCEVARKRVLETGTLTQLDAEVWLAELWLASSKVGEDIARSKALSDLVDVERKKLKNEADPDLAAMREASVEVIADEAAPRAGVPWRTAVVRFRGGYVSAFFDAAGREKFGRVAAKFADATSAEMSALYGRCGHLRYHDIGAWFRGATPTLAGSSLVYSVGFFSERRLTNHDSNVPPTGSDLADLVAAMGKVEKGAFEPAVRDAGGTYAPGAGGAPTTISFPLGGPTRAGRAAATLARNAGRGADAEKPSPPVSP